MKKKNKSSKKKGTKRTADKEFKLLERLLWSTHTILILLFLVATLISGVLAFYFAGTIWGTISLSFAVAFATATIVDFAYNYAVMKDLGDMVAKHLILNKEVQNNIMKREKIDEILTTSLENMIGQKLAEAVKKSIIDKIASERDLFLMERAYYSVILNNSTSPVLRNFFEVTMISKFNMTLKSNKVIFYATDSDEMYEQLAQRSNDPSIYFIFYLPEGCGRMLRSNNGLLNKFLHIPEISIDDENLTESNIETQYDSNENVTIKIDFSVPNNILTKIGKMVRIHFKLKSLLDRYEHFFFRIIPRAYPSLHMSWDCMQTDIEHVEVFPSFLGTQPEIIRHSEDGKKIDIIVEDWVLPNNMVMFIWRLRGEKGG